MLSVLGENLILCLEYLQDIARIHDSRKHRSAPPTPFTQPESIALSVSGSFQTEDFRIITEQLSAKDTSASGGAMRSRESDIRV